ncbi:MAG: NfeD family protein [Solirubrobacteraceae bacterium]|jgi:membrane protein implicated in regulation of membrane protease activity
MGLWVLWVVVAGGFTVGEMHTNGFYLAPFALGAVLAAVLSLLGVGGVVSAVGFVAASAAVILLLRPIAMRHRRLPPPTRTGTAALVGQPALVIERIANHEGLGTVKIGGEVWTARSFDEDREIEPGEQVEVVEIRGATALVLP